MNVAFFLRIAIWRRYTYLSRYVPINKQGEVDSIDLLNLFQKFIFIANYGNSRLNISRPALINVGILQIKLQVNMQFYCVLKYLLSILLI